MDKMELNQKREAEMSTEWFRWVKRQKQCHVNGKPVPPLLYGPSDITQMYARSKARVQSYLHHFDEIT